MGRLPATFGGIIIKSRIPYEMYGELSLTSAQVATQYPDTTFQNNVAKPFEVHRLIPRLYALDAAGVLLPTQPDQELLAGLVRIKVTDLGLTEQITKVSTKVGVLCKGSSERTWEYADPYYIPNNTQWQIIAEPVTYPAIDSLSAIQLAIGLQGYHLILGAPGSSS